jgi:hypothetical protein
MRLGLQGADTQGVFGALNLLIRPDLHFVYNLIETAPLGIAFFRQVRRTETAGAVTRAVARSSEQNW